MKQNVTVVLLCVLQACNSHPRTPPSQVPRESAKPRIVAPTHGVITGEVTDKSAIVWTRCEPPAKAFLGLWAYSDSQKRRAQRFQQQAAVQHDGTVQFRVENLSPATRYHAWVECSGSRPIQTGSAKGVLAEFRTAPSPEATQALRFVYGGDVGGGNYCRDINEGYPSFKTLKQFNPNFFLALGDMIYADNACKAQGALGNSQFPNEQSPARSLEDYRARWRYNRLDKNWQHLASQVPYFATWDDHEVIDNFGPYRDAATGLELMPVGRRVFVEYTPFTKAQRDTAKFYRSVRWGRLLEVFMLDTRSYREPGCKPDTDVEPKSMLGRAQREWLIESVAKSTAVWKVVVSGVPVGYRKGKAETCSDSWADYTPGTGYHRELLQIWKAAAEAKVSNYVWLTGDVHFASGVRYRPFPSYPTFTVHEFVAGPISATPGRPGELQQTLKPEVLFLYACTPEQRSRTFAEVKRWFNFGLVDIDVHGTFHLRVVNGDANIVHKVDLHASSR